MAKGVPQAKAAFLFLFMIDIIIPVAKDSKHNFIELRYCLRSIEKHLKNYGNVYIIGIKPDWINNIIHLPATDKPCSVNKSKNIYDKIILSCNQSALSDNFIFFSDDHFLLRDFDAEIFPYYHKGLMKEEKRKMMGTYEIVLKNTLELFPETFHFNIHSPIVYNKEKFKAMDIDWKPYGYALKTYYCNTYGISGEYQPECKIYEKLTADAIKEILKDRLFFSTCSDAFRGEMVKVLQEFYPVKSIYER